MGRYRNARTRTTKKKCYKKALDTKRRPRDIDQIQDDLAKIVSTGKDMEFSDDEDLPGGGQFYCTQCARHFLNEEALKVHCASKLHKRRLKDVAQKQYTHTEAELAAGKTIEKLPPAHGPRTTAVEMTE